MSSTRQSHSPETRRRANASLRLLTRIAALAATGATVAIGIVVAKEHPGGTASNASPVQAPTRPTTSAATPSTTTTVTSPPTTTPTSSGQGETSGSASPTTTTSPPTTTTILPPTTTTTRPVATSGGTSR